MAFSPAFFVNVFAKSSRVRISKSAINAPYQH
jgi:hypothetical protein